MPCDNKAFLKGLQVAVCTVALVYKVMTMWEAERITLYLQKHSREWNWATYTHAISFTSVFMDITFGGYFIICLCFLIGHLMNDPKTTGESFMMIIGFIMMSAAGGILITSTDDVPEELMDNTIILAVLALIGGILFLTDAGTKCAHKARPAKEVKTTRTSKDIEIIRKPEEVRAEEAAVVVEPTTRKEQEEPKQESKERSNGISSVQIRIKDPKKNWAVYGDSMPPRSTSELDVLAEAEAVDRMLNSNEQIAMSRSSKAQIPRLRESPIRHTSSFYITPTPHFAWKRLSERQNL